MGPEKKCKMFQCDTLYYSMVLLQKSWTTIQQHPHSLIIAANKKEFAAVVNKVLSLPLSMQIRRALMWW